MNSNLQDLALAQLIAAPAFRGTSLIRNTTLTPGTIVMSLLRGPREGLFFMSEVPVYSRRRPTRTQRVDPRVTARRQTTSPSWTTPECCRRATRPSAPPPSSP